MLFAQEFEPAVVCRWKIPIKSLVADNGDVLDKVPYRVKSCGCNGPELVGTI